MRCPICSTENDERAQECIACGYMFVTKKEEPESWVLTSASGEDIGVDGYGNTVADGEENQWVTQDTIVADTSEPLEEIKNQEDGRPVSVITVTVPYDDPTKADTDYELQTNALFEALPEQEEEETEETGERVLKAVKAPITARETGLLITVTILIIALLAVLGYFLLSGKLAESIHNFTDRPETSPAETVIETEPVTEPSEAETEETTEESTEESTEEPTEESTLAVEQEDGTILYDNAVILAAAETGYVVQSYVGADTIVVLPGEYDGTPVTAIGDNAFANRSDVTQVSVPEGVISIGSGAFYGCSSLQVLALPDSLMEIGANVFDYAGRFTVISHRDTYAYQYCIALGLPWMEGSGLLPDGAVPENPQIPETEPQPPADNPPETDPPAETDLPAAETTETAEPVTDPAETQESIPEEQIPSESEEGIPQP